MKIVFKCIALYIVCFLISAAVIAALELISTSSIDVEKVLTISTGPTLCIGTFYLLRLIKKESAENAKKKK